MRALAAVRCSANTALREIQILLGVGLWGDAVKVSREEQEEARELLRYHGTGEIPLPTAVPSATVLPSGTLLAAAPAADESAMRGRCLPPGAPPTSSSTVTIKASPHSK